MRDFPGDPAIKMTLGFHCRCADSMTDGRTKILLALWHGQIIIIIIKHSIWYKKTKKMQNYIGGSETSRQFPRLLSTQCCDALSD